MNNKMLDKTLFVDYALIQPMQRADGKWVWGVVSFGYDAEIFNEEDNKFAFVKTEADSIIGLLTKGE